MHNFFEVKARNISTLLKLVEKGYQSQVELFLRLNPKSIIYKDALIGFPRSFPLISAFELMAWNWDIKHMGYAMLYQCLCFLPMEDAEEIRIELLKQSEALDLNGMEYQFKSNSYRKSHYDFSELIESFYLFLNAFNHWSEEDRFFPSDEQNQLWENYNLAQQNAPAHILQHYNDPDVPFRDPAPDFNSNRFNRTGVTLEWADNQHRGNFANSANRSLARAIIRSRQEKGGRYTTIPQLDFNGGWRKDILAIEGLYDARQQDWKEMKELLKKPIPEIISILEGRYNPLPLANEFRN